MKNITFALVLLLVTTAAAAQELRQGAVTVRDGTMVRCESMNNDRHKCDADVRSRMVSVNQQLSDTACIQGRSWGISKDRKSIWVDHGCRAEFLIGGANLAPAAFGNSVVCESRNNGKTRCPADTSYGVQLARQMSRNGCERGRDWGFDENGVWVDHGCRAEFTLGAGRSQTTTAPASSRVTCESENNGMHRCDANTYYGVTLARQLSNRTCVRGRTWGYDANGIWVTGGCRAEFVTGQ